MSYQRTVVLDVGSGASLPNKKVAEKVVREIDRLNSRCHRVILKPQLFENIPPNKALELDVFDHFAALVGEAEGLELACSVFDESSLKTALRHDLAHIKIACREDLYWLAGKVPREVPLHVSFDFRKAVDQPRWPPPLLPMSKPSGVPSPRHVDVWLICVPEYPAEVSEYVVPRRTNGFESYSDHTVGLDLFESRDILVWEKHFVMKRDDPSNPDSLGGFAITPEDLPRVL